MRVTSLCTLLFAGLLLAAPAAVAHALPSDRDAASPHPDEPRAGSRERAPATPPAPPVAMAGSHGFLHGMPGPREATMPERVRPFPERRLAWHGNLRPKRGDILTVADIRDHKTAGGLSVYLGVVPASLVRREHPPDHPEAEMHDGPPRGRHVQHVMVAVFDAASGELIEDAKVEVSVASVADAAARIGGEIRSLQPMVIADTVTYGNYFTMRGDGPYRIRISVAPAGAARPIVLDFSYDHRTR